MRRLECIEPACRSGVEVAFTPWHAGSTAVLVLGQTRRTTFSSSLDEGGRISAWPGPSTPQGSPGPQNGSHPAWIPSQPGSTPSKRSGSPSGGPRLLCRLRGVVRCDAVRSRSAPLRSARIPTATTGAPQTNLHPSPRADPHPLDTEPSSKTTFSTVHHTHHRVNDP